LAVLEKYFARGLTAADVSSLEGILEKIVTHFQLTSSKGHAVAKQRRPKL
jgi:hypothetical protein